jgi:hypothetical protein
MVQILPVHDDLDFPRSWHTGLVQTLEEFLEFENRMVESLADNPDAIGLVFVGSAADHARFDEWSDHDFYLVAKEGSGEKLRQDLSWLPDADQIAISPRETDHGLKVVYESGHVLEFAVFNDSELEMAGANYYLVALDKVGNLETRMAALQAKSSAASTEARTTRYRPEAQYELLLCQVLIGVGRARRGELLIAGEHVRSWAVAALVGLIRHWLAVAPGTEHLTDNLASLRRFERQYPAFGQKIAAAQASSAEECGRQIVAIALEAGAGVLTEKQIAQAEVVSRRLGW